MLVGCFRGSQEAQCLSHIKMTVRVFCTVPISPYKQLHGIGERVGGEGLLGKAKVGFTWLAQESAGKMFFCQEL